MNEVINKYIEKAADDAEVPDAHDIVNREPMLYKWEVIELLEQLEKELNLK